MLNELANDYVDRIHVTCALPVKIRSKWVENETIRLNSFNWTVFEFRAAFVYRRQLSAFAAITLWKLFFSLYFACFFYFGRIERKSQIVCVQNAPIIFNSSRSYRKITFIAMQRCDCMRLMVTMNRSS